MIPEILNAGEIGEDDAGTALRVLVDCRSDYGQNGSGRKANRERPEHSTVADGHFTGLSRGTLKVLDLPRQRSELQFRNFRSRVAGLR
jgi:hypothetical protein